MIPPAYTREGHRMDPSDQQLLQNYLGTNSDSAFRALVERHAHLVYSAALRITRQHDLAEDAAQRVFAILTRKARSLAAHPILAAWLHKTATLEAKRLMRKERRHQQKLRAFAEAAKTASPSREEALPSAVDDALASLNPTDRQFLLLRFYEGYQVREIADLLGKSQAAARKQSERALSRLGKALGRRGVATSSSAALALGMSSTFVKTSHAALLPTVLQGLAHGPASASITTGTLVLNTVQTMTYTKQMALTAAAVALLAAIPIYQQRQQIAELSRDRAEDEQARRAASSSVLISPDPSDSSAAETENELTEALNIKVVPLREATLVEMGYRMAERNLQEAIRALDSLTEAPDRREFLKGAFSYAAEHRAPREVLTLAQTLDESDRKVALLATVATWTSGRAIESGSATRFTERYGLEAGLGMALVIDEAFKPELGAVWADVFADIDGRASMIGAFATAHLPDNPTSALDMGAELQGFDAEMFHRIVIDNWAQKDPSAAWQWLESNIGNLDASTSAVVTEVMADLATQDLSEAAASLESLTEPLHRQRAIEGIARSLSYHQGTEPAVRWANELPSESEQDAAHRVIAENAPKGIGAALRMANGFPEVTGLIAHGAAENDGRIQVGDRIVAVDSGNGTFELVYGRPMKHTLDLIHGDVGSEVRIRVVRNSENGSPIDQIIELKRQQIVLPAAEDRPPTGS